MNRTKNAWINLLFLIITLVVNTLGAVGVINGLTQKQISDMYPTLITPGPATFSIWSVIYALLLISMIVMIVKKNDPYYQKAIDEITVLFRISCLLNIAWIVAFSFVLVELSTLFILAFVIVLALIGRKLLQIQEGKRWLLPLSFGLYNGWLVIATVGNIAAALVKLNWDGFGIAGETWAAIILVVAVLLVIAILLKLRNAAFPLPVAWAYFGIYQSLNASGGPALLQTIALAGMAVLIGAAAITLWRNHIALLPEQSGR
jgi:hypothetical protein